RCSWLTHHLTDWMGDHGRLLEHRSQIRHHNVVGDSITITGRVTEVDGDVVTITQEAHNQHGELSATGRGRVDLG
ncbi:MAG: acyl dehydratase, partial [Actinomycetia bacterium]|nr:acyl dehydratase [Actinomycetes bacterium]